jgi:23S rRNA (pseudouridine1915-N3)-methyltransferase
VVVPRRGFRGQAQAQAQEGGARRGRRLIRLTIVAVGRARPGPERDLYEQYARRITWPLSLREVEEKRRLSPPELMTREGELLRAACPHGATLVALDRRGKVLDSAGFAQRLGKWRDDGVADLAFLIGGADGHTESLLKDCMLGLSFGAMTWPHLLARAMLAEQIYRAQQILAGHPYHRE